MHEIFFIRNYKILALIFHSGVFLHGVSRGPFIAESEIHTSMLSSFSGMLVFLTGVTIKASHNMTQIRIQAWNTNIYVDFGIIITFVIVAIYITIK